MKLEHGDYCKVETKRRWNQLLKIEKSIGSLSFLNDGMDFLRYCGNGDILLSDSSNRIKELTFEEFKQRAINTFKP